MSESSAPKLRCAEPLELPEEKPRAKPLHLLSSHRLTEEALARRTAESNRKAALKLLRLRLETGLTQVDAGALTGDASRTIGRYERAEVDLGPLRVFIELLDFRARQRGEK